MSRECPLFVQALCNMAVGQEVYFPVALQRVAITIRTATDVARDGRAKWLHGSSSAVKGAVSQRFCPVSTAAVGNVAGCRLSGPPQQ